jgi:tRNA/rRNA methyltransferase
MALSNCRVVLVRPQVAGNIGATARAMRNFGLSELVLVAPLADPLDPESRQRSTHGESILHQSRTVGTLDEALADCLLVAGTSARVGGPVRRQSVGWPRQVLPRLAEVLSVGPAALVFGPEPSGLTDREVTRCHHLVHIPAEASYLALNLGQAVAICLYELRLAWLERSGAAPAAPPPAPFADQERMFDSLQSALEAIHFLYEPGGEALMHALRHLIGRAGPTAVEVDILFGLARQLRWLAEKTERRRTES